MFQRKKVANFFPLEKYSVCLSQYLYKKKVSSKYPESHMIIYRNFSSDPKILAFEIFFKKDTSCTLSIDFNNAEDFNIFYKVCNEELKKLLTTTRPGIINTIQQDKSLANYFSDRSISYSIETPNDMEDKINLINNFLIAIHKTDPMNIHTIKNLEDSYAFMGGLSSMQGYIKLFNRLTEKLDKAYIKGSMMGLFSELNYPVELGRIIGKYLDPQTGLNVALTCKSAANAGSEETIREAELLHENLNLSF